MTNASFEVIEKAQYMSKEELNRKINELLDKWEEDGNIDFALEASEYAEVWRKRYSSTKCAEQKE